MRFYFLQLSRFIAAIYVVFFHKLLTGTPILDFIIQRGDMAVSFFFILSGFVITHSLLRKPVGFNEYLTRRCLKILPQWYLSMGISLAVAGLSVTPFRVLVSALLLQTAYPDFSLDVNFVGWSLSVELIMYIALFAVLRHLDVKGKSFAILTLLVWLITQTAFLSILQLGMENISPPFNMRFFTLYHPVWHLNAFLIGILCAAHADKIRLPGLTKLPYPALLLTASFLMILITAFYIGYKAGVDLFYHNGFLAPLTGLFICLLTQVEKDRMVEGAPKRMRLFDTLGGISFGIYLFHIPIYHWLNLFYPIGNGGTGFWAYLGVLLMFCYASFRIFDQSLHRLILPASRLGRR